MKDKSVKSHPGSINRRKTTNKSNLSRSNKSTALFDLSLSNSNSREQSGQCDLYYVLFILIMLSYEGYDLLGRNLYCRSQ
jgi:hypothetical protein